MESIREIEIDKEKIFLKRSFDGWRVIYPYKNLDGSYNWFNILTGGSYFKLLIIIIIILIICFFLFEYWRNLNYCTGLLQQLNTKTIDYKNFILKN